MLSVHQCATLACLLDVTAPKPGNVHRGADFEDMTFLDFAKSAVAIGPAMANAATTSLGRTVIDAVKATRGVTNQNTNLGIILLMAPLAKAGVSDDRKSALAQILKSLSPQDSQDVFAAIRIAQPGGLGQVSQMDVMRDDAPADLLLAMRQAAPQDLIARQYVTNFNLVLDELLPQLVADCSDLGLLPGIVNSFLWLLSREPDSLIRRKLGDELAREASHRASRVRAAGGSAGAFAAALADFDFWLRADGNRRNPGTSADLITAAIFVGLLDGTIDIGVLAQRLEEGE